MPSPALNLALYVPVSGQVVLNGVVSVKGMTPDGVVETEWTGAGAGGAATLPAATAEGDLLVADKTKAWKPGAADGGRY